MSPPLPKVHNGVRSPWTNMIKVTGYNPLQSENRKNPLCESEVYAFEINGISNDAGSDEDGSSLINEKNCRLKNRFCCINAAICCLAVLIFILIGAVTYIVMRANENSPIRGENFNRTNVTYTKEQTKGIDKGDRDTIVSYKTNVEEEKFGDIQTQPLGITERSKDGSLLMRFKRTPHWVPSLALRRTIARSRSRSSYARGSSGIPEASTSSIIISLVLACSQLPFFTRIHL